MVRTLVARLLRAAAVIAAAATVVAALPVMTAQATSYYLCTGYTECTAQGMTSHQYENSASESFWGQTPGHNCTNFVAYMLQNMGIQRPPTNLGNAGSWGPNAQAVGVPVNNTPTAGSVAWWGTGTISSLGHVAIVESVSGSTITVSEDNYPSGPFAWQTITLNTSDAPTGFIHFLNNPAPPARTFAPPSHPGQFGAINSARLLDTRVATDITHGAAVPPAGSVTVKVAGRAGIPAVVAAAQLNLTVVAGAGGGFITAYPGGTPRPTSSNANFVGGQIVANAAIVPVGADGTITLYNASPTATHLIVDASGYYLGGTPDGAGGFTATAPTRLLDTRVATDITHGAAVAAGGQVQVQVGGRAGIPTGGVSAADLNVTVTDPTASGFLSVRGAGTPESGTSTVNYVAGQVVPNLSVSPVGANGEVTITNHCAGTAHIVVDVSGWFAAGGSFSTVAPARLIDTRLLPTALYPAARLVVPVAGRAGVPAGATAAIVNLTLTQPGAAGFVVAYGSGLPVPGTSNINFVAGQTVANAAVVPIGSDGTITLQVTSSASTQAVVDVFGYLQ